MGNIGKRVVISDGIIVDYSQVTVDSIITPVQALENGIETDKFRVQLRQVVKTTYPKARGNALFQSAEFGPGQDFDEKRVTWLNVPEGTTVEQIVERLNTLENPTLVRTLGLKPILSESQLTAMQKGINTKTWEQYAENYVRNGNEGLAVKFQGRLQYRAIYFSDTFVTDNDNRITDLQELQAAEAIAAQREANGSSAVQMSSGLPVNQEAIAARV